MKVVLRHWFSHIEISSLSEWKTHVLNSTIPVIVQFHADWSEKSNKLKKQLQPLNTSLNWNIIEVNIDTLPALVKTLDLKIIPTLYVINKGRTIDKFESELPEKKYQNLVNKIKLLSNEWNEEDFTINLINIAYDWYEKKHWDDSIEKYTEALNISSCLEKYELTCWIGLAQAHFYRGDYDNSQYFIDRIKAKYSTTLAQNQKTRVLIDEIITKIGYNKDNSQYKKYQAVIQGINQEIFEDPFNNKIHARLAIAHYDFGFIEEGINKALQIIDSEASLTGNGYKVLMEIVKDLGPDNQNVKNLQPKLQRIHMKYRKV